MQRLKVLLCLQLHPHHSPEPPAQPTSVTAAGKTQTKTLEQLGCTNKGQERSKEVKSAISAGIQGLLNGISRGENTDKDALRIPGCNKWHSKGVLITLIAQEERLPHWNWWLPAAEQDKADPPAENSICTCYCRGREKHPAGEGGNASDSFC